MSAALYTDFTFASSVVLTALGCVLLGIVRIPSDRDPAAAGKLRTAMIIVGDSDGTSWAVWLDGRGHKIYRSDIDPSIMSVSTNSRLVLTDITLDGRDGSNNLALLLIETGGAAVLGKGTTLQNTKGNVCCGVHNKGL